MAARRGERPPGSKSGVVPDLASQSSLPSFSVQEQSALLASIFAHSPDTLFFMDRNLRYTWFFHPRPPYTPEDVVGKTDFEIHPWEEAQELTEIKKRVLETGAGARTEVRTSFSGTVQHCENAYEPLRDQEGRVVGIAGYGRDITEHRQAQIECERLLGEVQQLAEVAQRRASELEAILDNMVDGVFVCDLTGRITLTNEAGVRLLGMSDMEEVKRALSEYPEPLRIRHLDGRLLCPEEMPLAQALAGKTVSLADILLHNGLAKRDIYIRTSAAPMKDESGNIIGAVAVGRDVTELTELDRAKDQFITVAAHELKTPVAIMKGYAQALLRSEEVMSAPQRKMLNAIDLGADRIVRIVDDLLDISRLQDGRPDLAAERIDLAQLAEEVAGTLALSTNKHGLRVVSTERVVINGDVDRLSQVLTNLVDNAIRYSPDGGDIQVEVAVLGPEAVVSVRDQGVGIPIDQQADIFQRFHRPHTGTPFDYGGMGVGLYMSREVIARMGGRMWFESEEDSGSTFYFSLPLRGERGAP